MFMLRSTHQAIVALHEAQVSEMRTDRYAAREEVRRLTNVIVAMKRSGIDDPGPGDDDIWPEGSYLMGDFEADSPEMADGQPPGTPDMYSDDEVAGLEDEIRIEIESALALDD